MAGAFVASILLIGWPLEMGIAAGFACASHPGTLDTPSDRTASQTPAHVKRLWERLQRIQPGRPLPSPQAIWLRQCRRDMDCVARALLPHLDSRTRLVPVMHPDTDTIRLVKNRPSIVDVSRPASSVLRLSIVRFGRTAEREVLAALTAAPGTRVLELDLRGQQGGRLRNMLRLAGLFTGAVPDAVILAGARRTVLAVPARPQRLPWPVRLRVLVDRRTASSAEIFAALLRRHAGARILGERTFGKDWVARPVAVSHDWRLLVPAERVIVPGESLAGGLEPDAPLPAMEARTGR